MVLLFAVALGIIGGLVRAKLHGETLQNDDLRLIGLVFIAFIPQFLAFSFHPTRVLIPDRIIPFILIGSQIPLLIFAWVNRRSAGFWLLGAGLLCNFLVILLNGGFMPLPPENARQLIAPGSGIILNAGDRAGFGKDMVLAREDTRLWFLGDVFMLPAWLNYPLAFSFGDILIALGAFCHLWNLGRPQTKSKEVSP
jgi:hypothetical protein